MNKGGAAREVSVPSKLKGKTEAEIRDWARAELHGQEALLDRDTLSKIKRGDHLLASELNTSSYLIFELPINSICLCSFSEEWDRRLGSPFEEAERHLAMWVGAE